MTLSVVRCCSECIPFVSLPVDALTCHKCLKRDISINWNWISLHQFVKPNSSSSDNGNRINKTTYMNFIFLLGRCDAFSMFISTCADKRILFQWQMSKNSFFWNFLWETFSSLSLCCFYLWQVFENTSVFLFYC
jgi:hypothetical protein